MSAAPLSRHLEEKPLVELVLVRLIRHCVLLLDVVLINNVEQNSSRFPADNQIIRDITRTGNIYQTT